MKRLILDTSNLLFRVAAARGKYHNTGTPEEQAGLAAHMALNSLNSHFKKYSPDQVAVTFEGSQNWRKAYTKSPACLSKKVYKANRVKDASMDKVFELIQAFEDLARNHTSLVCLSHPQLEGDDLFAGYVQRFTAVGDEVIGVSGDKDFVQLLRYPNFQLINPDTNKPRTLLDVCGQDSADYFMFEKGMRGDKGDNVFPAYPRVLKKRLLKCLTDDYERTKLMNETWTFTDPETGKVTEHRVGDLYEENLLLMDLQRQPAEIRKLIDETLDQQLVNHGSFSFFHFSRFCGKFGLKEIGDNAANFADLFNVTGARSPHRAETEAKKKQLLEM